MSMKNVIESIGGITKGLTRNKNLSNYMTYLAVNAAVTVTALTAATVLGATLFISKASLSVAGIAAFTTVGLGVMGGLLLFNGWAAGIAYHKPARSTKVIVERVLGLGGLGLISGALMFALVGILKHPIATGPISSIIPLAVAYYGIPIMLDKIK